MHPDESAVKLEIDDPRGTEARENPTIRYGRGYVLSDGCWLFENGSIEAFETVSN